MDRELKPTLIEKAKARVAVFPMLKQLTDSLAKTITEGMSNIRIAKIVFPQKQEVTGKVEISNLPDYPEQKAPIVKVTTKEVNVTEKVIEFPDVQPIEGTVTVTDMNKLQKSIDMLNKNLTANLHKFHPQTLPTQKILEKNKKVDAIPVIIKNQQFMIGESGGSQKQNTDDRTYIREEYSYTTINNEQVVSQVKKYTNNGVLTENYTYNNTPNPTSRSRSWEPLP
jgi:hypothetical protein